MRGSLDSFSQPAGADERAYLESLIRTDYERCRPGDTFDDLKRRVSFSKEDNRLYREWMATAAARRAAQSLRAAE